MVMESESYFEVFFVFSFDFPGNALKALQLALEK